VQRIDIQASDETRRLIGIARQDIDRLQIRSHEDNVGLPLPCTIEVVTPDGATVASLDVQLNRRVHGHRGITVSGTDQSSVLTVSQLIDHERNEQIRGTVRFNVRSPVDHYPYAMRPVADFLLALQSGRRVRLRLGSATIGYADIDDESDIRPLKLIARTVAALDELQSHFGSEFPVPDALTRGDLAELEMLVELFTHARARWTDTWLRASIYADKVDDFLSTLDGNDGSAIVVTLEHLAFVYGNHRFDVGAVRLYGPKMQLTNRDELASITDADVDPTAAWECFDDESIYITLSDGSPDATEQLGVDT
jgi:hypothetical protein